MRSRLLGAARPIVRRLPNWIRMPLRTLAIQDGSAQTAMATEVPAATQTEPQIEQLIDRLPKGPFVSHPDHIFGLDKASSIHPTARLFVRERAEDKIGKISLGAGVYLGTEVELAALNVISIGDDTSIQNYCTIHGDVSIGAHCLFGPFVLIGSTVHRFRDIPYWLIRDQDEHVQRHPGSAVTPISAQIVIEDDCWLGSSVAIMPDVYIGRGAVVGANSVVTNDIGPYEVHGGVPNRRIGERLTFSPPRALSALTDMHLPYFYRGFRVRQADLGKSRLVGMIGSLRSSCLLLAASSAPKVRLKFTPASRGEIQVQVRINGIYCGTCEIDDNKEVDFAPTYSSACTNVPKMLSKWTSIEIDVVSKVQDDTEHAFGVSAATLLD
jgi:acetyltransferase-like isoleucine patch superfamily enzyme